MNKQITTETKRLAVEVKDSESGTVEAVFSTFNVRDHDGDVTLPGAFEDGAEVRISAYGHRSWMGALPVGKGRIRMEENRAVLEGQFFLDSESGKQTFVTVKNMGGLQEWSYGYDVIESESGEFNGETVRFLKKLKVHEVSPVLVGAGIETETLRIKEQKANDSDAREAQRATALKELAHFERTRARLLMRVD